jgi:hypothetical protein
LGEVLRLADGEFIGVAVIDEARVDGVDEVGDDMMAVLWYLNE